MFTSAGVLFFVSLLLYVIEGTKLNRTCVTTEELTYRIRDFHNKNFWKKEFALREAQLEIFSKTKHESSLPCEYREQSLVSEDGTPIYHTFEHSWKTKSLMIQEKVEKLTYCDNDDDLPGVRCYLETCTFEIPKIKEASEKTPENNVLDLEEKEFNTPNLYEPKMFAKNEPQIGYHFESHVDRRWRCTEVNSIYPVKEFTDKALMEELVRLDSQIQEYTMSLEELLIFKSGLTRVYQKRSVLEVRNWSEIREERSYIYPDSTIPGIMRSREICEFETPERTAYLQKYARWEKKIKEKNLKSQEVPAESTKTTNEKKKEADEESTKTIEEKTTIATESISLLDIFMKTLPQIIFVVVMIVEQIFVYKNDAQLDRQNNEADDGTQTMEPEINEMENDSDSDGEETADELVSEDDTQSESNSEEIDFSDDSFENIEL